VAAERASDRAAVLAKGASDSRAAQLAGEAQVAVANNKSPTPVALQ